MAGFIPNIILMFSGGGSCPLLRTGRPPVSRLLGGGRRQLEEESEEAEDGLVGVALFFFRGGWSDFSPP